MEMGSPQAGAPAITKASQEHRSCPASASVACYRRGRETLIYWPCLKPSLKSFSTSVLSTMLVGPLQTTRTTQLTGQHDDVKTITCVDTSDGLEIAHHQVIR